MPASSRLLQRKAGSEVIVEVKLSLADKQAVVSMLKTWGSPLMNVHLLLEETEVCTKPVVCMKLQLHLSQWKEGQLSLCGLWSVIFSLAMVNNSAHGLMRLCLHYGKRKALCRRLEVNLYHIYLQGGIHPVNMPLRQEEHESGVWQPPCCSPLRSTVPSQSTQSDSAVMKSEAHGRLYVIISGFLKPDREWLSWMVIVTLPPC